MAQSDDIEYLEQLMKAINEAWLQQQFDRFDLYFHEEIVFNSPDFSRQIKGRDACVQSYRDFMRIATIDFFKTQSPHIDLTGATAVIKVPFEMHFQLNGKQFREKGTDIFVCSYSQNSWRAVWRCMVQLDNV